MKPKSTIDPLSLIRMIEAEKRAEYQRYLFETESPLSKICDSSDALGPLKLKEKLGFSRLSLSGEVFYSRFRPGDSVEVRTKVHQSDRSVNLSYDWKVETVVYPTPGRIEIVISGAKPIDTEGIQDVFLFKNPSSRFNNLLIKKLNEISNSKESHILGAGIYNLSTHDSEFRVLYEELNGTQQNAIEYLISNNLNGAIQGPPGTGKTTLLKAVVALALSAKMKVCITSLTHTAVDNLLGQIVSNNFSHEWMRVGDSDRVRKEYYKGIDGEEFISKQFSKAVNESDLIGSTLHKLAYNKSAPKVDLLIIDEAGQVPIYFWPFIQRLAKRIVLVGDQYQLPPVLAAKHADLPFDNVFSFLINEHTPMLEIQYRMRREIQAWSSEKFYRGKLTPHSSVAERDFFEHNPTFITDGFVVPKKLDSTSSGRSSINEANFITDKVERLLKSNTDLKNIGVICPYRAQAGTVNATLQNRFGTEMASRILVDTVERFQGQEKEAIFLSLGSACENKDELRFLSDPKRLNVSITRAKSRFFCLFDAKLIQRSQAPQSEDLNEFLRWVTLGKTSIKRAA
jgi:DNA replication ATP-dependent helicase Dna2